MRHGTAAIDPLGAWWEDDWWLHASYRCSVPGSDRPVPESRHAVIEELTVPAAADAVYNRRPSLRAWRVPMGPASSAWQESRADGTTMHAIPGFGAGRLGGPFIDASDRVWVTLGDGYALFDRGQWTRSPHVGQLLQWNRTPG